MTSQELIGKTIVRLRLNKKISQETLANEAGVDRRYMSDIENGKRNISLEVLNRLSAYFKISLSTFLREAEIPYINSLETLKESLSNQGHCESIVLESPDYITAVIGISEDGRVVYSYEKMVEYLILSENIDYEAASEFVNNTIKAIQYMGSKKPIIIYNLNIH